MAVIGSGVGLAISQIGNVNLSAADACRSTEVGGLQGTAQNLGSSLGVALAGTVLFIGLAQQLNTTVTSSAVISPQLQQATAEMTSKLSVLERRIKDIIAQTIAIQK